MAEQRVLPTKWMTDASRLRTWVSTDALKFSRVILSSKALAFENDLQVIAAPDVLWMALSMRMLAECSYCPSDLSTRD